LEHPQALGTRLPPGPRPTRGFIKGTKMGFAGSEKAMRDREVNAAHRQEAFPGPLDPAPDWGGRGAFRVLH